MGRKELRFTLEGHLDTLRRNLDAVPREVLKTQYRKPYNALLQDIRTAATGYVKEIVLGDLRIRSPFLKEATPIIQTAIDQSGLLKVISEAAYIHPDINEIDRLAGALKEEVIKSLQPFYKRHTLPCLNPNMEEAQGSSTYFNEAAGCIFRNHSWHPLPEHAMIIELRIKGNKQ